ncbi:MULTISPECIES: long-chain-fatty-acid--CoA ligase [Desulfococcus]|uniref:AMP-dependent synthetase and ligase n=1 Tax=Desulfococcus multivorans DSM 2059 TaxID=1121405 RepID=S7TVW6_DESML|nr:long-chain fatty acid--CoA ligase [Desulfococcus multivorans]AOY59601.1 FadD5: long-chain-fatty-acid--CoA ligase [Desulfococcus multivorans]AQV01790.1 long-chain-fatty-acid--CoA ligase [Desulfococcus multivorans]EPR41187.1 AMP-dependent synthetase and ligase [Desulfococcus multivorans DSM 2059]SKA25196.1 long-chain acyl-CoA synthetase [Desulfococcus multivorans DSM 2059]
MNREIHYQDRPWQKSYGPHVKQRLDYEATLLPRFLEASARDFPNRTALIFEGYTMDFNTLNEMVNRFAACLHDMDVRKGDRVAILLPNTLPCVISYYAAMKIGAITVMNNPLYSDRELEHQFVDSGAKILITLDLLGNRMIDLRPRTRLHHIVITSIGDYLPFPKNLLFPLIGKRKKLAADVKPASDVYRWKKLLSRYAPNPPEVDVDFEDTAMYQYTGGTTGVSKGVMLTHANLSRQVQQIAGWFPGFRKGEEIMLGALPFFHVFGLSTAMNFAVYMGWTDILVPKPQPDPLLKAIARFKPSFVPLVPTMFIGLLNHPDIDKADLTSIKGCFSGSAPLPVEIIRAFEEKTGSVIVEGYGLTETTPVTHVNPYNRDKRKIGSIGLPISDTLCRIVDLENGEDDVPVGKSGELLIKGPQVMKGYLNMQEETEAVLTADGWLHTGDIARMDEDGYFYIVDRKKDMIISGGYNVYPRDIEEVYYGHPKVQEACAVGIPHETRGEAVKVYVVLKAGETATEAKLLSYCRDKLAKYKWPIEIEIRESLPKTNVGKILKKNLRLEAAAGKQ